LHEHCPTKRFIRICLVGGVSRALPLSAQSLSRTLRDGLKADLSGLTPINIALSGRGHVAEKRQIWSCPDLRPVAESGPSYHYLPTAVADSHLVQLGKASLTTTGITVRVGSNWTTYDREDGDIVRCLLTAKRAHRQGARTAREVRHRS